MTAAQNAGTVEIIIPVRNMSRHIEQCASLLSPQLRSGDRLTVVDDASDDSTAAAARAGGAEVMTLPRSRGPYVARQLAAGRSDADHLLFVDARSRARKGLLDAHRALLDEPNTALSCTNVEITAGASLASQVAALSGLFDIAMKVGVPNQLDSFPTCNLGVTRDAFITVGGFRLMRSGGDVDLCWRVQLAGLGRMRATPETLMDWIPRDSMRALAEQSYRYGKSGAWLDKLYAGIEATPDGSEPRSVRIVAADQRGVAYLRKVVRQSTSEPQLFVNRVAGRVLTIVQRTSHRLAAHRRESSMIPPTIPFD